MSNLVPLHIDKDSGKVVAKPIPGIGGATGAFGYVHEQITPVTTWTITHGGSTQQLIHRIFDSNYEEVIPDKFKIVDADTVEVTFSAPMSGIVHLIYFAVV